METTHEQRTMSGLTEQEQSESLSNDDDSLVDESYQSEAIAIAKGKREEKTTDASEKSRSTSFKNKGGDMVWKSLMVVLLALIGLAAGFAFIYGLLSRDEKVTDKYFEYADHIAEQSLARARQIHSQMAPMNSHWTSHAMNDRNESWPFVTLPDFHSFAESFAEGVSELIAIAPIVTKQNQEAWEHYSIEHQQWTLPVSEEGDHDNNDGGLTARDRRRRRRRRLHSDDDEANSTIPTRIYTRDLEYDPDRKKEYRRDEVGPGPFAPLWQMYPQPVFSSEDRDLSPVNYNVLSHPSIARAVKAVQTNKDAILTEPLHLFELFGIHGTYSLLQTDAGNETMSAIQEPHSVIVSPVYKDFAADEQDKVLVAVLLNVVPWKSFFENLLPQGENGIVLVLESQGCGDTFTFQVNGRESVFVGYGDIHDQDQDYFDSVSVFGPFMTLGNNREDLMTEETDDVGDDDGAERHICQYYLHKYPSNEFYQAYHSDIPRIFAAAMVGIFLFVCAVLKLYNLFAARQERRIQLVVQRSNAIVEKFFPSEVRNRLLERNNGDDGGNNNKVSLLPKKKALALPENQQNQAIQLNQNRDDNAVAFQGKPIATLFPQCTVMFAQIIGFTEWSLERSPEDTFTLLETCYREFDELTKRCNVFKVETIGDCYLAVTGLPEPQKEHALIMARFSRAIMEKFRDIMGQLEASLGPETSNLKLRIGLNSGPVTAGVLRGQKTSHFQLFGDTVNTASRMQSTGVTGRIQVSVETAALLQQSSSSKAKSWLTPREEKIVAKGKGEMSTMWLSTIPTSIADSSSKGRSSSAGSEAPDTPQQSLRPNVQQQQQQQITPLDSTVSSSQLPPPPPLPAPLIVSMY